MSRQNKICAAFLCVFGLLAAIPGGAAWGAETIRFPIRLDYSLLRVLVISQVFTDPDDSATFSDPTDACRHLSLSNPVFQKDSGLLKLKTDLRMQGGIRSGEHCRFPFTWEGGLVVYFKPRLNRLTWQLSFQSVSSELVDKQDQSPLVMGNLWAIFEGMVLDYLGHITIELAPPVRRLQPLLLQMVAAEDAGIMEKMLETIRPGDVLINADGLKIDFLTDVEIPPVSDDLPAPAAPLTEQELADFIDIWEAWDAFLVQTLLSLAPYAPSSDEREILLGVLLDTRYQFIDALLKDTASDDFVRKQFTATWETLVPILRRHLAAKPPANPAAYLAFFTAADALVILDRLGPAFDIDISRNGLIHLIRMLAEDKDVLLTYAPDVDPGLRALLGMGPPLEASGPVFDMEELPLDDPGGGADGDKTLDADGDADADDETAGDDRDNLTMNWKRFLLTVFPTAGSAGRSWAANLFAPAACLAADLTAPADPESIRQWLVSEANLTAYLADIRKILGETTLQRLADSRIPGVHQEVFRNIIYAAAWQESCFRQFIEKQGAVTYLRSYNNTSVGMMQINERVWRGIYDPRHLKWDIAYNARAGVEIMDEYMTRYALPRMDTLVPADALDADGLAGAVYAMYNSGPGDFSKYIARRRAGSLRDTDLHFREKYNWVKTKQWRKIGLCLFGKE
jgi:hypothetical protein